jgi:hypothetical protein
LLQAKTHNPNEAAKAARVAVGFSHRLWSAIFLHKRLILATKPKKEEDTHADARMGPPLRLTPPGVMKAQIVGGLGRDGIE